MFIALEYYFWKLSVVGFDMERGEQFLVDKVWEMYNANNLL